MCSIHLGKVLIICFFKRRDMKKMTQLLLSNPKLKTTQAKLLSHPIYTSLSTHADFKLFMERHCWAVWDFLLLVKELQRNVTNTKRFWTPCLDSNAARFVNQIILGEETDITDVQGQHLSHFELYLKGMEEIGAKTQPIMDYIKRVSEMTHQENTYSHIEKLILEADSPEYVKKFNLNTCAAIFKTIPYTAGQLFFGREDLIPFMFKGFMQSVEKTNIKCPILKFYFSRHIELDQNSHAPKASHLLLYLGQKYDPEFTDILEGACEAIEHRIMLWDGILVELKALKKQ